MEGNLKPLKSVIVLFISLLIFISCTGNKVRISSKISSIFENTGKSPISVPSIETPVAPPTTQETLKQVETIQHQLNQDTKYSLTPDDVSELQVLGIVDDKNEIKGWVK